MTERCPFCGTDVQPPGRFCVLCGRQIGQLAADLAAAIDTGALDRLRREKHRLSREISTLRETAALRDLTAAEARSWEALRAAWQNVTADLTAQLDAVAPRQPADRRTKERRMGQERRKDQRPFEGPERRSGMQRRDRERRTGRDRRAPPDES